MPVDPLLMLLAALAVYRLARLIALEEGPDELFVRLREWAGAYNYDEAGRADTSLGRGIGCPLCVGMWAAALLTPLALWPTPAGSAVIVWLGLAGAQALIHQLTEGD